MGVYTWWCAEAVADRAALVVIEPLVLGGSDRGIYDNKPGGLLTVRQGHEKVALMVWVECGVLYLEYEPRYDMRVSYRVGGTREWSVELCVPDSLELAEAVLREWGF